MGYSVDVIRRVLDDNNGNYITVSTDGEIPGNVIFYTDTKDNQEYWGMFRVSVPYEMARALADALNRCATESAARA